MTALADRITSLRRQQAKSAAGQAASPAVASGPASASLDVAALMAQFEILLPVMTDHWGYDESEIAFLRGQADPSNPERGKFLQDMVPLWRSSVYAYSLDDKVPEHLGRDIRTEMRARHAEAARLTAPPAPERAPTPLIPSPPATVERPVDAPAVPAAPAGAVYALRRPARPRP